MTRICVWRLKACSARRLHIRHASVESTRADSAECLLQMIEHSSGERDFRFLTILMPSDTFCTLTHIFWVKIVDIFRNRPSTMCNAVRARYLIWWMNIESHRKIHYIRPGLIFLADADSVHCCASFNQCHRLFVVIIWSV